MSATSVGSTEREESVGAGFAGADAGYAEEQLDDLEAGELSVEFEGQEPWDLLEWAIERFGGRLAISTAFQEGDVALIDMAYKIDPEVRVFSMDTGRLPQEVRSFMPSIDMME